MVFRGLFKGFGVSGLRFRQRTLHQASSATGGLGGVHP